MIQGIHHVSLKCADPAAYERAKRFYIDVLGLRLYREWDAGCMLASDSGRIEIFHNGPGVTEVGAVRHFALACDDVDGAAAAVKAAGYEVFIEPKDVLLPSSPPIRARIAFCRGPLNEEIEFFDEKG